MRPPIRESGDAEGGGEEDGYGLGAPDDGDGAIFLLQAAGVTVTTRRKLFLELPFGLP